MHGFVGMCCWCMLNALGHAGNSRASGSHSRTGRRERVREADRRQFADNTRCKQAFSRGVCPHADTYRDVSSAFIRAFLNFVTGTHICINIYIYMYAHLCTFTGVRVYLYTEA